MKGTEEVNERARDEVTAKDTIETKQTIARKETFIIYV